MYINDLNGEVVAQELTNNLAVTATGLKGSSVDLNDYDGSAKIIVQIGAATAGSSPTMDVKIQDSADNSSFADVTGATVAQVTTVALTASIGLAPRTYRRYVKLYATIGGTSSPSFPISAVVLAQKKTV